MTVVWACGVLVGCIMVVVWWFAVCVCFFSRGWRHLFCKVMHVAREHVHRNGVLKCKFYHVPYISQVSMWLVSHTGAT